MTEPFGRLWRRLCSPNRVVMFAGVGIPSARLLRGHGVTTNTDGDGPDVDEVVTYGADRIRSALLQDGLTRSVPAPPHERFPRRPYTRDEFSRFFRAGGGRIARPDQTGAGEESDNLSIRTSGVEE